jgi:hypothetical protein
MAVVTVDQASVAVVSQFKLAAYAVQRFLRGSGAAKTASIALMDDAPVDAIAQNWSGGYANSNPSTQIFAINDFAPNPGPARVYSDSSGSRPGLDSFFTRMDAVFTAMPNCKIVLAMFDHPQVMLQGQTRTGGYFPWPPASQWGATTNGAATLASEILTRYGTTRIIAFEYGLELKGINWGSGNFAQLDAFVAGYTAFATYMHANWPTIECWYPHLNFFAHWGNISSRRTAMDNLVAGGSSLEPNDEIALQRLLLVNPALVDAWTLDSSIVDYSTSDTWRGNYAAVEQRVSMPYHLGRVVRERMTASWGSTGASKPMHHIESYFDVNQLEQDWATDDQQAALSTAILMWCMKNGQGYHMRWEPTGGTPGAESPNGNIASWWSNLGVAFPAWAQARDLRSTFPPGTALHTVTTDDNHIVAVAGGGKVYLLNTHSSAISVSVTATGGTLSAQSIPAYSYLIQNLPSVSSTPAIAGHASGLGVSVAGAPYSGQAKLTIRMG